MKNKINSMYKSIYPLLRKVDRQINIEIVESFDKPWLICSTYYSTYYEDNGEYIKTYDFVLYANSIRSLKTQLKQAYYLNNTE